MNLFKLLLVLAVAAGAYHFWKQPRAGGGTGAGTVAADAADDGFVPLPPVRGQSPAAVLVIAAEDCPHEDAQRADRLADDLSRSGVPVTRLHNLGFDNVSADDVARINAVMGGTLPVVIVRGRGRANPSLAQVLAAYRGTAP